MEVLFMAKHPAPRQKSWPLDHKPSSALLDGLRKHKSLRFADSEGLPLVTVLNIYRADSCESLSSTSSSGDIGSSSRPRTPVQQQLSSSLGVLAQWGVGRSISGSAPPVALTQAHCKRLRFEQNQPSSSPDFHRTLQRNLVTVENVAARGMSVFATVRVRNIAYEKNVAVRYTTDDWKTSQDRAASYVQGSSDGPTDRFSFTILPPEDIPIGGRLQFAVLFQAASGEFWDNNAGKNYSVVCEDHVVRSSVS